MLHHHDKPVTDSLIAGVLPALVQAIRGAGDSLAIEIADGRKVNISHRTQAQQLLMFALADLLVNCLNDHSEDHIYPPLRPYELADMDFCRQWFDEIYDREDAGCVDTAAINAAIDEDEAERADTEPIYTVADIHATPAPEQPAPIRKAYQVSWDTELTEESIAQGVIYPFVKKQLDEVSEALATTYAPTHVIDGKVIYDTVKGKAAARRAVLVSFLSWLQTDPALADDGTEIALLTL
jgi:hypothetical protein